MILDDTCFFLAQSILNSPKISIRPDLRLLYSMIRQDQLSECQNQLLSLSVDDEQLDVRGIVSLAEAILSILHFDYFSAISIIEPILNMHSDKPNLLIAALILKAVICSHTFDVSSTIPNWQKPSIILRRALELATALEECKSYEMDALAAFLILVPDPSNTWVDAKYQALERLEDLIGGEKSADSLAKARLEYRRARLLLTDRNQIERADQTLIDAYKLVTSVLPEHHNLSCQILFLRAHEIRSQELLPVRERLLQQVISLQLSGRTDNRLLALAFTDLAMSKSHLIENFKDEYNLWAEALRLYETIPDYFYKERMFVLRGMSKCAQFASDFERLQYTNEKIEELNAHWIVQERRKE